MGLKILQTLDGVAERPHDLVVGVYLGDQVFQYIHTVHFVIDDNDIGHGYPL